MKRVVYIMAFSFAIYGCQTGVLFEKNIPVNTFGWNLTDTLNYEVVIPDTLQKYDLSISLRHRDIYNYTNLYLTIITQLPTGEVKRELVSLPLCDEGGKWLGKCSGDVCYAHILLMKKIIFPRTGHYKFKIVHEMRQTELKNILDIGLRIEKSKKKIYTQDDES